MSHDEDKDDDDDDDDEEEEEDAQLGDPWSLALVVEPC